MIRRPLRLGCTWATHKRIGVHAVVNARSRRQDLNEALDVELVRDAIKVREITEKRIRHYQFGSRWFRRRFAHLLASRED